MTRYHALNTFVWAAVMTRVDGAPIDSWTYRVPVYAVMERLLYPVEVPSALMAHAKDWPLEPLTKADRP
jgi:hypothetical protein